MSTATPKRITLAELKAIGASVRVVLDQKGKLLHVQFSEATPAEQRERLAERLTKAKKHIIGELVPLEVRHIFSRVWVCIPFWQRAKLADWVTATGLFPTPREAKQLFASMHPANRRDALLSLPLVCPACAANPDALIIACSHLKPDFWPPLPNARLWLLDFFTSHLLSTPGDAMSFAEGAGFNPESISEELRRLEAHAET